MRIILGLASVSTAAMVAVSAQSGAVMAQDGLAGIHAHVRIGKRLCMADHFHSGSGSGATQKAALAVAINDWASFTAWEYSQAWAHWRLAETRKQTCSPNSGGWSCTVEARPCKQIGR